MWKHLPPFPGIVPDHGVRLHRNGKAFSRVLNALAGNSVHLMRVDCKGRTSCPSERESSSLQRAAIPVMFVAELSQGDDPYVEPSQPTRTGHCRPAQPLDAVAVPPLAAHPAGRDRRVRDLAFCRAYADAP